MIKDNIAYAAGWVFYIAEIAIFVSCVLSWVPALRNSIVGRVVDSIAGPILNPIRSLINRSPLGGGGMPIDFSPMIALILLDVLRGVVTNLIRTL